MRTFTESEIAKNGSLYHSCANESDSGPFYVLITRCYRDKLKTQVVHRIGGTYHEPLYTEITEVQRGNSNKPVKFENLSSAQNWIKALELHPDKLEANESGYPIYTIVSEQY